MLDIKTYYEQFLGDHIYRFRDDILGYYWQLKNIQYSYLEDISRYTFLRNDYGLLKVYTKSNKLIRIEI